MSWIQNTKISIIYKNLAISIEISRVFFQYHSLLWVVQITSLSKKGMNGKEQDRCSDIWILRAFNLLKENVIELYSLLIADSDDHQGNTIFILRGDAFAPMNVSYSHKAKALLSQCNKWSIGTSTIMPFLGYREIKCTGQMGYILKHLATWLHQMKRVKGNSRKL